jgi:tetratricopeptide (TPR) repeat protein
MKTAGFRVFSIAAAMALVGCAGDVDKNIESARFLIDQGKFTEAIAAAEAALAEDPGNVEAAYLLGTAQLGKGVLGEGQTFLGLFADLQEDNETGESDFETFVRIAPDTTATLTDLEAATDTLAALAPNAGSEFRTAAYFKLYLARLFEIAGAITRIGANQLDGPDNECNADPNDPDSDGIPDAFKPDALGSGDRAARFQTNLDTVNDDAAAAGLTEEFALTGRLKDISDALAADITAEGGDVAAGVQKFFEDEFGYAPDAALCIL